MLAILLAAGAATPLALPASPPVIMDYLATEGARVWVPAGNTGKVFVLEAGKFRAVDGFATKGGRMGPSAVTLGPGYAWIGNRGDARVWAVDARTLEKKGSAAMPSMPDGVFFVAPTREVWVTTPGHDSIEILDVKEPAEPAPAGRIELPGRPEGYAVDADAGVVYTNLEDADRTLAIDARKRTILWSHGAGCGAAGPRGLALDAARGVLFVACAAAGVNAVDAKTGVRKGHLDAGEGVDNIDYVASKRLLYASAGRAETLTVARLQDDGSLAVVASAKVGKGSRVVVATPDGTAYAADSAGGRLWVFRP